MWTYAQDTWTTETIKNQITLANETTVVAPLGGKQAATSRINHIC